jgi:hypothetical protein
LPSRRLSSAADSRPGSKTPELAKVANLHVDPKSYWLYTNDPYDNVFSPDSLCSMEDIS